MSQQDFSTSDCSLSDELIEKARVELNENPETRQHDIQVFREMIQNEKDLSSQTDDAFLLRFLRARKFNFDRALILLKGYYKFRLKYEDEYKHFYPSAFLQLAKSEMRPFILPESTADNCKVIVFRLGHWDTEVFSYSHLVTAAHLLLEIATMEEAVQISGIRAVVDLEKYGYQHVTHTQISSFLRLISMVQDTLPVRIKSLHFIRLNRFFNIMFAIAKPFLGKKVASRIFLHNYDLESLHKHIPAEILPEEYGGEKPPVDNSEFLESIFLLDDYFKNCNRFGYKKFE